MSSMPPMPGPAGAADLGSGISVMMASVVSIMEATEAAFRRADLVTLAGSTTPKATMSP